MFLIQIAILLFNTADFFKTPLKGVDFTNCDIDHICISDNWSELRGLIVNPFQAAELAKFLGVTVRDEF